MSWNQPCCDDCWAIKMGARVPVRLVARQQEQCAFCGRVTRSGIYLRQDPATVRFPAAD